MPPSPSYRWLSSIQQPEIHFNHGIVSLKALALSLSNSTIQCKDSIKYFLQEKFMLKVKLRNFDFQIHDAIKHTSNNRISPCYLNSTISALSMFLSARDTPEQFVLTLVIIFNAKANKWAKISLLHKIDLILTVTCVVQ